VYGNGRIYNDDNSDIFLPDTDNKYVYNGNLYFNNLRWCGYALVGRKEVTFVTNVYINIYIKDTTQKYRFKGRYKMKVNLPRNKKGVGLNDMLSYGLLFVAVAIVLAVGGQVLGQIQATVTENTSEYNTTVHGLTSLSTLGQWLPIIAIVIAAVIIIGILVYNFRFKR
jgi:hypothetical protein